MRRPAVHLAGIGLFALIGLETMALAHESAARRTVVVQAEATDVAVLVTWTAPSGPMGRLMMAAATWGRSPADAKKALRTFLATRALATLSFKGNGEEIHFDHLEAKVNLDRGTLGRHTVAILATKKLPSTRPYSLSVRNRAEDATRLSWADRSGTGPMISSNLKSDSWTTSGALTLTWQKQ